MSAGTVEMIDRDLEARKHLWKGLQRMTPPERAAFVQAACGPCPSPGNVGVKVTGHTGTVHEAYMDLMLLGVGYGRDMFGVCAEMEAWLRKRG